MRATSIHSILCPILFWSSAFRAVEGFVSHGSSHRPWGALSFSFSRPSTSVKRLSASSNSDNTGEDEPHIVDEPPASTVSTKEEQPANPYPIDVPSPILLSASMVLAIASTGEEELTYPYACSNDSGRHSSREVDLDLDVFLTCFGFRYFL
jgi:hypothetical protein